MIYDIDLRFEYTYNNIEFFLSMPDFQQGKIYKIRSTIRPDLIYIGSTTQTLSMRMTQHRAPSSRCSSHEIIAVGDAYIELIENFPCNNKDELNARENRHMRALQNVINRQSAQDDCTHGRKQTNCVECHGSGICDHNKQRSQCVECHGSQVCEHNRQRSQCVECHGSQVCEHNRQQNNCVDCHGSGICQHNRVRSYCVECHGSQVCEHTKRRSQCVECHGSQVCEHTKRRSNCVQCSSVRCEACNKTYTRGNHTRHIKSAKHIANTTTID